MSDDARIFMCGSWQKDEAGKITIALQVWSARNAVTAAAAEEALHALLGEPEEEVLLDDAASQSMYAAAADCGAVVLRAGDEP